MTIVDLVFKQTLSALWSAGHAPSRSQIINMKADAYRHAPDDNRIFDSEGITQAAVSLLRSYGYAPDTTKPLDEMLPETQTIFRSHPRAGHAVRLTGPWSIAKVGTIMTLSTTDERHAFKIGRGGHYMHENGSVSLSCGGPSSIMGLPDRVLVRTNDIMRLPFWRFQLSPEANGGVDFTRPAPIWEWDGNDTDFSRPELAEAA